MEQPARLKVLFVITKANFGGAQRYVHDLARAAEANGHDVVVVHGGDGLLGQRLRSAGIRTLSLPVLQRDVSLWADLRSLLALYRIIRAEAPDVVHLNSSKAGILGALAARLVNLALLCLAVVGRARARVGTVFTGHGWAFNEERSTLSRLVLRLAHWLTIVLSHCVIAVSEATRRQVLSLPLARGKVVVVHNGVSPAPLCGADEAWARIVEGTHWQARWPRKPPVVVGVLAELHRNKGLRYAIDAIALLRWRTDERLVFVVLGEGEERAALAAQITRLGLDETVLLAGFRRTASELLRGMDIFLLSSVTEAFPYALLEAGSAGLPVIATRVGGVGDLVVDAETGLLVPPRSPDAIARAILFLLEHPERRARFARALQSRVAEGFSAADMSARTLLLYRSVTDRLHGIATPLAVAPPERRTGPSLGPVP